MKAPKTSQNLVVFLGTCVLFLIISTAAWATASPVIFYSDLTSGPNTGGQNNNGVFVTIWGNNFGSTEGASTVTVGGGAVANYQTWTNTEICFQLGSLTASGKIVVTTSNGTSNGVSFTVRSGNIYFIQPGASSNGTGTYASPFSHLWYAYNVQKPGDTVYVLAGTIHDEENGYTGWHSIITTQNAGTQADPIAYVAYPNATVILQADGATSTWTAGSSGGNDPVDYIFRDDGGSWTTISKFTMELTGTGANTEVEAGTDTGWRVVGNTLTANAYIYAQIDFAGPNTEVIGNTIYNSGAGQQSSNEDHSIYLDGASNQFEIGWNYLYGNQNSGWEISCFHQGQRNGSIHDNLIIAKSAGSVKGILLGDVDTGETQSTEWGSTYKVYNNIIVNAGQADNGGAMQLVDGTGYIYNNTIYYSGTETKGIIQVPTNGVGPNGGDPVWYFADNIIVANNAGLYISDENGNAPNWSFFALLADNNYYGQGNGPTNDSSAINANPQFVSPGTTTGNNFQLQVTSPDINAGYNTTSIVSQDLNGLLRSAVPSIGAYEYAGSVAPSSPVVSITSPSTGSTATAGTNITITATASETNGSINNISIYNGSTLLGASSSSPYSYVMSNVAAGTYTLTAVATDANGVSTTSSAVTLTVNAQQILPSSPVVNITSPSSGSTYTAGANVTITTTASEINGTISNISLYNGSGILLGSSSTSPYNYVYNGILAGGYSFYAVATDANGVSTTSSAITVTVTAPPAPVVSITSPTSGSSVTAGSNMNITASASETNGTITNVAFYNGSTLLGSDSTSPYTYVMSNPAAGSYTLIAVATDANGVSTTSSTVSVTVSGSTTPVVAITSPSSGNTFSAGSNITITANASVGSGSISKVSFYNGSTLLGTDTSSPYTYTWSNVVAGNYSLTAKAYNSKKSATSSAVAITVTTPAVVPSITTQPVSMTVTAPATANFSVVAAGTPAPTYQWMQSNSGAFTAISGATSASYTTAATTTGNSGTQFECVVTNASGSVTSNAATLTVNPTPVTPIITTQPVSMTVTAPATATFTVAATGTPTPTYQWMQEASGANSYTAISGANSTSYTTAATTTTNSGAKYECVVTNASGSVTSSAATLTVNPASVTPSITTQPVSMTVTAPATATFSVVATGTPAPTYQWIQSINGGAYTAISGATSASYTTAATTITNSGTQFECVVINASGSVTTNAATLTVNPTPVAPSFTGQPTSATVTAPATATFSVAASGTPAPTYQWMQSVNGGAFAAISGATSASYTTAATTTANSGNQFKCVVTNASGSVTSSAATLTVNPAPAAPSITSQPVGMSVTAPATASFSVVAAGTPAPTYQWMQSVNGGAFTAISGATSSSYTTAATTTANSGAQFECVVTNASGSVTSNAATLTVEAQPVAPPSGAVVTITNPTNGSNYLIGSNVPVTVTASENNGMIRYIYLYTGSGVFLGSSAVFASSGSFTYTNSNMTPGTYSFYALATDVNGIPTLSGNVTITVTSTVVAAPSITAQPASVSVIAPATATFSVVASGTPAPTYQWMQSNGGAYTAISGATSASYTTAATTTGNSGTQFKCVVTNASGSATSNAATLTVNPAAIAPSITAQPVSEMVTAPATATFTVVATGTPAPSYQWMQSVNGGAFTAISGATSASYTTASTTISNSGTKYECVVTNAGGSATSNAATLTVNGLPVIAITSPSTGSSVTAGSDVSITATASETNGTITNVAFYNGSTLLGSDSTSPYTYVMSNPAAGSYTLTAVATDANGVSTTSSPVTITVAAQPDPSAAVVSINPANGSNYSAGSSVPVTVTASETNGSIRYIYLYTGSGVFLGSNPVFATTGNFTYTNSNMTPGNYSFYAIATDVNGVPTQSSTAIITVK